ncbi:MAG: hypothetical protein DMF93_23170 [Acidobacteria bacterium]|nr:MAG: hypothetical protein DMF93_23170 [Acidobacteriota bacterium]
MAAALAHASLPPDDDEQPSRWSMSLLEHLEELRKRLVRACVAIAAGVAVSFLYIDRIVAFVFAPMRRALPPGAKMIYTAPGEAFGLYVNIALLAGTVLAAPFIMFQIWRFIAPALYAMITFFGTFHSADLEFRPRVEDAFDLYTRMLLGMVLVFQMPTVIYFLAKMRLVTARFLAVNTKYAILIIFIVAAVLTPDGSPWNQTLFAAPMIALYLLGIAIAWAVAPRSPAGAQ